MVGALQGDYADWMKNKMTDVITFPRTNPCLQEKANYLFITSESRLILSRKLTVCADLRRLCM